MLACACRAAYNTALADGSYLRGWDRSSGAGSKLGCSCDTGRSLHSRWQVCATCLRRYWPTAHARSWSNLRIDPLTGTRLGIVQQLVRTLLLLPAYVELSRGDGPSRRRRRMLPCLSTPG